MRPATPSIVLAGGGTAGHNSPLLAIVSAVPLGAALAVYVRRNNAGGGEAPEQLLLHDHAMELLALAWVVLFVLAVQVG